MANTDPVRNSWCPESRGGDRGIHDLASYPVELGPLRVQTNNEGVKIPDLSMIRMFPHQAHNARTPVANAGDFAITTSCLADALSHSNFTAASIPGAVVERKGVAAEEIMFKRFSAMLDALSPQVQSALGITPGMCEAIHQNSVSIQESVTSPESESLEYAGDILNNFVDDIDEIEVLLPDNISRRPSSTSTLYNSKFAKPQREDPPEDGPSQQIAPAENSLETEDTDDSDTNYSENATDFTKRQSRKQRITRIVTNVRRPQLPAQTVAVAPETQTVVTAPDSAAAQPPSAIPGDLDEQLRTVPGPASAQLSALGYNPMGLFTPGPILRAFFGVPPARPCDAQAARNVSPPAQPKPNEASVNSRPSEVAPESSKIENAPPTNDAKRTATVAPALSDVTSTAPPTLPTLQPPQRGRSGSTYSLDSPNLVLDPLPFLDLDALLSFCKGTMQIPNTPEKADPKESNTTEAHHIAEGNATREEKHLHVEVNGTKNGCAKSTPLAGTPNIQPTRLMLMLDLISARSPLQPTERAERSPKKSNESEDSENKPMSKQNMRSRHALSVLMRDIEQEVLNFLGTPTTPQLGLKIEETARSPKKKPSEDVNERPPQPRPWIPPPPKSEPDLPQLNETASSPPPLTSRPSRTASPHSNSHHSPTNSTAYSKSIPSPDSLTPLSATSPTSSHLAHLDRHLKSLLSFLDSPSSIYLPEFVGQLAFRASDVVHRARGIHFLLASPYVHSHADGSYSAARVVALEELHEAFAEVDRVVRMALERMTQKDLEVYVGAKGGKGSATGRKPPPLSAVGELIGRLVDGVEVLRLKCLQLSLLFA
ncbi:hypothetical protein BJ742DRAFT_772314 [Cladochytrium replicatum]|nr:hypothetical protein BJ742DRAFT_772314 [Cladochytrium replicatum]